MQLTIFGKPESHDVHDVWQIFVDGASRNNPGPSGAGIFIKKNDKVFLKKAFFLHKKTNNEAEYLALVLGLLLIAHQLAEHDVLEIISDSQLLINQLSGHYKVKKDELKKFHTAIKQIIPVKKLFLKHVLREYNKEADTLANEAIDKKVPVPAELIQQLSTYDIQI